MESSHDSGSFPPRDQGDLKESAGSGALGPVYNYQPRPLWLRLLVAPLMVAAASVFRMAFFGSLGESIPFLFYFPAVTLAALYGGLMAGLMATVLSANLVYFWIDQQHLSPPEWLALAVFVLSGALISYICEIMHRGLKREKLARAEAETANQQLRREMAERKQSETDLRASEEHFRRAVVDAPFPIMLHAENGAVLQVSNSWCEITGYTRGELATVADWTDFAYGERKILVQAEIDALYGLEQRKYEGDYSVRTKSGARRIWEFSSAPLGRLPDGRRLAISMALDVTERRQAEAALQASEERFRTLVEKAPEAVFIQTNGCFAYVNAAALRLFGATQPAELLGQPVVSRVHPDYQSGVRERIRRLNEQRQPAGSGDIIFTTLDGAHRNVITSGVPFRFQNQDGALVFAMDITERKLAEAALAASQGKLKAALASMTDAVFISDAAGQFVDFNDAFATVHRFKNKAECAKTFAEYPDILDVFLPSGELAPIEMWAVPRALRGETVTDAEYTLRRKDTGETWVGNYSFAPIRDQGGTIIGSVVTGRDITERKRAEKALQERTSLLRVAGRVARFGGWSVTLADGQVIWSEEVAAIHDAPPGFSPSLPEGINFYAPECREKISAVFNACVRDGAPYDEEMQIITARGRRVWVRTIGEAMRDAAGAIIGVQGAFQDITEPKQAEALLQRTHHTLLEAQKIAHLGSFEFIAATRTTKWSEEQYRIYGLDPAGPSPGYDEMLAKCIHPNDVDSLRQAFTQAMQSRAVYELEHRIIWPDGSVRWIYDRAHPYLDEQGELVRYVGITLDITERKLADEKIKRIIADLERSNQELEHFAFVASHDLQEPLRMVASYTQLLAQQYESQLDEKAKKYIRYAVDGAVRMQALINDLWTYSRIGRHGKPLQSTDAHAVLGEAIRNLAAVIAETHAVITSEDLPTVLADASQLVQLFQNLLANAIKFQRGQQPRIHVSAREADGQWRFAVKDNGIGIEAQYAERVFIIFQRLHTREEYPGTGIGLAVCQRIVERHGGKIWFESLPGSGTTFFFTISTNQSKQTYEPH